MTKVLLVKQLQHLVNNLSEDVDLNEFNNIQDKVNDIYKILIEEEAKVIDTVTYQENCLKSRFPLLTWKFEVRNKSRPNIHILIKGVNEHITLYIDFMSQVDRDVFKYSMFLTHNLHLLFAVNNYEETTIERVADDIRRKFQVYKSSLFLANI